MTTLRSCFNCAFAASHCGERDKLRAAISGLGLTSVKHRCRWRRDRFHFGQAVTVETSAYIDYDELPETTRFPATFIQYSKGGEKCVCFIVPGTKSEYGEAFESKHGEDGGYVKVPRRRVEPRTGDGAPVCTRCHSAVPDKPCGNDERCAFHGFAARQAALPPSH